MLCQQLPEVEVIKAFNSPEIFLKEIPDLDFDLVILDIEMPGMNGLQIANLVGGKPVIFTTAYKEYAAEAFDLNAIDYVRKPVKLERLQQAIHKAQNHLLNHGAEKKFFHINSDKGKALIFFDQLLYIKVSDIDSRDKNAFLSDGASIILKNISFEKLLELLPEQHFVRINKKEVIALKTVQAFSFDEITTGLKTDGAKTLKLTLSDVYRNEFLTKIKV